MSSTPQRDRTCQLNGSSAPPAGDRKARDYHAEYLRRIELGRAYGLSRSQAAGHPRRHEISVHQHFAIRNCAFRAGWDVRFVAPERRAKELKFALLRRIWHCDLDGDR